MSAVEDTDDADESVIVRHAVTSADGKYSSIAADSVTVLVDDDEGAATVSIGPPTNLRVRPGAHEGLPTLIVTYAALPPGRDIALQVKLATTTGFPAPVAGHAYPSGVSTVASLTTATRTVLIGLAPGTTCDLRAHAYDGGGNVSASTASMRATTWTVPGAPENTSAGGGNQQLKISWTESRDKGGDGVAIIGCLVRWRTAAVPSTNTPADAWNANDGVATDTNISHTITGLTNGREYEVEVRALNGIDPGSDWSAAQGTPLVTVVGGEQDGDRPPTDDDDRDNEPAPEPPKAGHGPADQDGDAASASAPAPAPAATPERAATMGPGPPYGLTFSAAPVRAPAATPAVPSPSAEERERGTAFHPGLCAILAAPIVAALALVVTRAQRRRRGRPDGSAGGAGESRL